MYLLPLFFFSFYFDNLSIPGWTGRWLAGGLAGVGGWARELKPLIIFACGFPFWQKCYGGILIRGVQSSNEPQSKIIEGPCLVVDQILRETGSEKIIDLVRRDDYSHGIFTDSAPLKIVPTRQKIVRTIIKGPRVGLTLYQNTKERVDFLLRDYRYLIIPEQMTKGKPYLLLSLYREGKTAEEITDIVKTKISVTRKYIELYENNKHPVADFVNKNLDTDHMCEVFAAIKKT